MITPVISTNQLVDYLHLERGRGRGCLQKNAIFYSNSTHLGRPRRRARLARRGHRAPTRRPPPRPRRGAARPVVVRSTCVLTAQPLAGTTRAPSSHARSRPQKLCPRHAATQERRRSPAPQDSRRSRRFLGFSSFSPHMKIHRRGGRVRRSQRQEQKPGWREHTRVEDRVRVGSGSRAEQLVGA